MAFRFNKKRDKGNVMSFLESAVKTLFGSTKAALLGRTFDDSAEKAAEKAAKIQADAAQAGITEQGRQFDLTREDLSRAEQVNRDELSPFSTAGVDALNRQRSLLGFGGKEDQEKAFDSFGNSPGQQFLRDRARKNLLRSASSVGGNFGGNVLTALNQQGVDLAAQDFGNEFSRLSDLRRSGQDAATNIGSGAINTAARTGSFGQRKADNISNLLQTQGQARASGILGSQQANAQQFQQFLEFYTAALS